MKKKYKVMAIPVLQAMNGIAVEDNKFTPLSENTIQINGNPHSKGGTDVNVNGTLIEAEAGETLHRDSTGATVVGGNLFLPNSNKKFKSAFKDIAKQENKNEQLFSKANTLLETNPENPFDSLSFNTGLVLKDAYNIKHKNTQEEKQLLSDMQQYILETSEQLGMKPEKLSQMKNGGKIIADKGWKYNNTVTEGLDDKIKGFVDLVTEKGYSGYSGPKSGVSQRNTKSGRLSRHAKGQALDMFFDQPDVYNKMLNDPDIVNYLISNGLTILDEYNSEVAKYTGATAGHIHVGYDKGTKISEQFRKDAQTKYPMWDWDKNKTIVTYKGNNKKQPGLPSGDAQEENLIPINKIGMKPLSTEFDRPTMNYRNPQTGEEITKEQYNNLNGKPAPIERTSLADRNKFNPLTLLPEFMAAVDEPDYVAPQFFEPELLQPYQVSFQDRINQNNSSFRAIQQQLWNNPEALSTLAGQKYEADNQILGEQFRTNQSIANNIYNQNIGILNDAEWKNVQLADQQFVRQAQAKAITDQNRMNAANSAVAKWQQHQRDNNNIRLSENLFDYRPDEDMNMQYVGGQDNLNYGTATAPIPTKRVTVTDEDGNTKTITTAEYEYLQKMRQSQLNQNRFLNPNKR